MLEPVGLGFGFRVGGFGGFPKLGVPFLGGSILRTIIYLGVCWGPFFGKPPFRFWDVGLGSELAGLKLRLLEVGLQST